MNATVKNALAEAIRKDHPCDDRGCDIAVALHHGYVLPSALLLTGATETPAVDAVIERYGIGLGTVHSASFGAWYKFHRRYGRQCPSCEGFMYANPDTGDEPDTCSNCLASLSEESSQPS